MHLYIKVKKHSAEEILFFLFLAFCCIPFLFPNPIVKTNIQPYAALLGALILLSNYSVLGRTVGGRNTVIILGCTFIVSVIVMIAGGISIEALRGVYNYFALFIIPCSIIIVLEKLNSFPEKLIKGMIIIWFAVATIQFFIYRGFATQLISGVRWSYSYRGVVGLASEPSFLGIACFYFLHMIRMFKTKKLLFTGMVLVMGVVYAQSATGIMFIAGYFLIFLLDIINTKKGVYILGLSIIVFLVFIRYLNTTLVNSRLKQMVDTFFYGGVDSVLSDGSASVRFNAIVRSLNNVVENLFFPNGFGSRIGSAYGGLLVELGFFAIPVIFFISAGLARTFNKLRSRVAYFIVVTLLLLNNTQIGNPLLLMVIGINIHNSIIEKRNPGVGEEIVQVYQDS